MINALLSQAFDEQGRMFRGSDASHHPVVLALASRVPRSAPPWLGARSLIGLFVGGLAFYLGLHARRHIERASLRQVSIYFGGRGSSLLPWLGTGLELSEAVIGAFRAGLTLDRPANRDVKIDIIAPGTNARVGHLKEEAVRGLLADSSVLQTPPPADRTIVGEEGWKDSSGNPCAWDTEMTSEQLADLRPPGSFDTSYCMQLLDQVMPLMARSLELDDEGLGNLQPDPARLQNWLKQSATLQPIFARELKLLLEDYALQLGSRPSAE